MQFYKFWMRTSTSQFLIQCSNVKVTTWLKSVVLQCWMRPSTLQFLTSHCLLYLTFCHHSLLTSWAVLMLFSFQQSNKNSKLCHDSKLIPKSTVMGRNYLCGTLSEDKENPERPEAVHCSSTGFLLVPN